MLKKEDIMYVTTKFKKDYIFDAIKSSGFDAVVPYKDHTLFGRLVREAWFRLHLPFRSLLYSKKVINPHKKMFIVFDSQMNKKYFEWLKKKNPNAIIALNYLNRADTSMCHPTQAPDFVEKYSYDLSDCQKYHMHFTEPAFFDVYAFNSNDYEKEYDVLFVGRDKNRMSRVLDLEKELQDLGLNTYFYICADRKHLRFKNKRYQRVLDYDEYLELLKKSRASLNIAREDQNAITQRELECAFCGIKCITTNEKIKDFDLYDESRFFVLTKDNASEIKDFLSIPYKPIPESELEKYRFENMVKRFFLSHE